MYDPAKITYEQLLDIFWHNVDPFQADAQFCDHGNQYRSAIFYRDDAQQKAAEASKAKLEEEARFKGKIVTQIVPAGPFYAPRSITRISRRRTRSDTRRTARDAAATPG